MQSAACCDFALLQVHHSAPWGNGPPTTAGKNPKGKNSYCICNYTQTVVKFCRKKVEGSSFNMTKSDKSQPFELSRTAKCSKKCKTFH